MKDEDKTKDQLLEEIAEIRRHLSQVEESETECRQTEAEDIYKILAERSVAAAFIVQNGKVRFINTSAIAYAGYTREEMIGQDSYLMVHPEDKEKVKRMSREMLAGKRNAAFDFRIVTKQHNIRWISQTVTPIQYKGKPAILGNAIDVTELKQAENLYKILAESSVAAVFIVQDRKFRFINTSAVAYADYTREELIGQDSSIIVYPEDREKVKKMSREMLAGARNAAFEFRILTKRNNIRWISQTVTPILYEGKPAVLGNGIDITEVKQAEEALRENEKLHNIILGSPFPAFAIGNDHRIMHWNKAMEELSGIRAEEAIGTIQDLHEFYSAERPCMAHLLVDERIAPIPHYYSGNHAKSGSMEGAYEATDFLPEMGESGLWLRFTSTVVRDSRGNVIGAIETIEDVTEKKRAEQRLMESEELYRTTTELSNDGIAIVKNGHFSYVNRKLLEMAGYDKPEEIIGKAIYIIIHPDDREMIKDYNRKKQKGETLPSKYEFKGVAKDGNPFFTEVSVAQADYNGESVTIASFRDTTERRQFEEKLHAISIMDELTGLYNRRGFFTLAHQQLKIAERTKKDCTLFFIDVDKLKWINDTLGHQEGDNAIAEAALILKKTFRESDIIGRMGGDEFAILAIETNDESRKILMSRLHKYVDSNNSQIGRKYLLSLSTGIAPYDPAERFSLDELIFQADKLMYEEKRRKHHLSLNSTEGQQR